MLTIPLSLKSLRMPQTNVSVLRVWRQIGEEFLGFFKRDNKDRGVKITCPDNKVNIEMHIVVTYGINIPAISESIIHKVVYTVEQALDVSVGDIKVFVDAVINK